MPKRRLYQISYNGKESVLSATKIVGGVELRSTSNVSRGHAYQVSQGDFHQTHVSDDQFAATIALTRKYPGNPLVIGNLDGTESYSFARSELASNVRDQIVHEVAFSFGK